MSNLYGHKSKLPLVQFHHKDWSIQLDVDAARQIAAQILEAAEAAEQDAFLVEWVREQAATDEAGAAGLLQDFRKWKESRRSHD